MTTVTTTTMSATKNVTLENCSVRFGLGDIDLTKTWRTISVYTPDVSDELQEFVKRDKQSDKAYVTVKVHKKRTKITNNSNMSLSDLEYNDLVSITCAIVPWVYNGRKGASLKASNIVRH
jgi:hypothetical protein